MTTDFASGTDATDTYSYDEAGRLAGWTRTGYGAISASYGYDLAGNLVSKTLGSATTVYSANAANQLTSSVSGATTTLYDYDELGRLISTDDGSIETSYTWNDVGQLAQIFDGQTRSSYAYGIDGMRQMKVVDTGSVETTTLQVWSGTKLVSEYDVGAETRYDYLYGPSGMPLEMSVTNAGDDPVSYAYQCDAGGSVIGMTDKDGAEVARYAYDPYGNITAQTDTAPIAARNPLRYRGYYLDAETGYYYLPARYYDPDTARFISIDPAPPSAGSPESLNRYSYCMADPVQGTDPTGAIADYDGNGHVDSWDSAWYASAHKRSARLRDIFRRRAVGAYYRAYSERWHRAAEEERKRGEQLARITKALKVALAACAVIEVAVGGYLVLGAAGAAGAGGTVATATGGDPSDEIQSAASACNPLANSQYTPKVLTQMSNSADFHHSFPRLVDTMATADDAVMRMGGDGTAYTHVTMPGSVNGVSGNFHYIIDGVGMVNHRLFETW